MSRNLAVLPSAVVDMREAAARYESERRGLGRFFLQKLRALFQRVKNKPLQFPEIAHGIRRALVPKFPYGVFFRILEKKTIVADRRLCEETSARLARNRLPPWSAESYSNRDSRNTLDMRDRLLWLLLSLERPLGVS